jgi:hypothetical protein
MSAYSRNFHSLRRQLSTGVSLILVLGCALLASPKNANATLVRWDLHDVVFDDGGTASGFFVVDTSDPFHDPVFAFQFDVQTSTGRTLAGFEYSPATFVGLSVSRNMFGAAEPGRALQIVVTADLRHVTKGTFFLPPACSGIACSYEEVGGTFRYVTSGDIIASSIPEASQAMMLAFGLAFLFVVCKPRCRVKLFRTCVSHARLRLHYGAR